LAATKDLALRILAEEQDDYGPKIFIKPPTETPMKSSFLRSSGTDFSRAQSTP